MIYESNFTLTFSINHTKMNCETITWLNGTYTVSISLTLEECIIRYTYITFPKKSIFNFSGH